MGYGRGERERLRRVRKRKKQPKKKTGKEGAEITCGAGRTTMIMCDETDYEEIR